MPSTACCGGAAAHGSPRLTSGGAIPDSADYDVVLEPAGHKVGTVNEDFAVESLAGDVFQLGNTSYRIRRIDAGKLRVEDAQGQAPGIPFWLGEAPGRSDELSQAVRGCARTSPRSATRRRAADREIARLARIGVGPAAARQLVDYLASAKAALGTLPTQDTIVLERFFDESGGMQLVVHSPFGSRINRAWGLALRKRFCVKFNFELQAAATEDAIVISLSTSHSFPLADVARYLHPNTVAQDSRAGDARGSDVRCALAMGRGHSAGAAALPRRTQGRGAAATHARRRSDRGGVPRPDRLRREHRRRARDPRSSAGPPDHRRLPARSDGHRRAGRGCCGRWRRARSAWSPATSPHPRRWGWKS